VGVTFGEAEVGVGDFGMHEMGNEGLCIERACSTRIHFLSVAMLVLMFDTTATLLKPNPVSPGVLNG
jgi:hypothetical protein